MNGRYKVYVMRDVLHRQVSIRSNHGLIVVTSEADAEDHILDSGQSLRIRPRGMLAIRGLSEVARATVFGGRAGREGRTIALGSTSGDR